MISAVSNNVLRPALNAGETVIGGPSLAQLVASALNEDGNDNALVFTLGDGGFIEGTNPTIQLMTGTEVIISIQNAVDDRRYLIRYDAAKSRGEVLEHL